MRSWVPGVILVWLVDKGRANLAISKCLGWGSHFLRASFTNYTCKWQLFQSWQHRFRVYGGCAACSVCLKKASHLSCPLRWEIDYGRTELCLQGWMKPFGWKSPVPFPVDHTQVWGLISDPYWVMLTGKAIWVPATDFWGDNNSKMSLITVEGKVKASYSALASSVLSPLDLNSCFCVCYCNIMLLNHLFIHQRLKLSDWTATYYFSGFSTLSSPGDSPDPSKARRKVGRATFLNTHLKIH